MPEICRFYGIIISVNWREHGVPHFHATYNEDEISIAIENFAVLSGSLPPKKLGQVIEWAAQHKDELMINWKNAIQHIPLIKIKSLED